jgi:hypothetical protein
MGAIVNVGDSTGEVLRVTANGGLQEQTSEARTASSYLQ